MTLCIGPRAQGEHVSVWDACTPPSHTGTLPSPPASPLGPSVTRPSTHSTISAQWECWRAHGRGGRQHQGWMAGLLWLWLCF